MRGGFTDLACTHANDAIVGVQHLPSPSVKRQLKVLEQAAHVAQTSGCCVRATNGLQISNDDQTLRSAWCFVKWKRFVVLLFAQHALVDQLLVKVVGQHHDVHAVSVAKQAEASLLISTVRVEQDGPFRLGGRRPFHRDGSGVLQGEVGLQQPSKAATSREFEFAVLMSLPRLGRRVDQILCAMNRNSVLSPQPVNITLKEVEDSVPTGTSFAHRAEMERLNSRSGFFTHGNPMTLQNGSLGFVHHLAPNAHVDVLGAQVLVIVCPEVLLEPSLPGALEPSLQAAGGPHLTLKRHAERPEPMGQACSVRKIRREWPRVNADGDGFLFPVPKMRERIRSHTADLE